MEFKINQLLLQRTLEKLNMLAHTHVYTPVEYSNQVMPIITELNNLTEIKEDVSTDIPPTENTSTI